MVEEGSDLEEQGRGTQLEQEGADIVAPHLNRVSSNALESNPNWLNIRSVNWADFNSIVKRVPIHSRDCERGVPTSSLVLSEQMACELILGLLVKASLS